MWRRVYAGGLSTSHYPEIMLLKTEISKLIMVQLWNNTRWHFPSLSFFIQKERIKWLIFQAIYVLIMFSSPGDLCETFRANTLFWRTHTLVALGFVFFKALKVLESFDLCCVCLGHTWRAEDTLGSQALLSSSGSCNLFLISCVGP